MNAFMFFTRSGRNTVPTQSGKLFNLIYFSCLERKWRKENQVLKNKFEFQTLS